MLNDFQELKLKKGMGKYHLLKNYYSVIRNNDYS